MRKEIWRPCFNKDPYVEVSSHGRFRRIGKAYLGKDQGGPRLRRMPDKIWIPQSKNNKGYQRINLRGDVYFVHRVVLETFQKKPFPKAQTNHKDGNKENNFLDNLEWVTNYENRQHAVKTGLHKARPRKISYQQFQEIKRRLESGATQEEAGKRYGVNQRLVSKYLRTSWKEEAVS